MRIHFQLLITILVVAVIAGCGKSGVPTVPVRGKVTFAGGPPPAEGTITFTAIAAEEGLPRRPGTAHFDQSGEFETTSFTKNDGLIPGKYRPKVTCWTGAPSSGDPSSFERLNAVPVNFQPPDVQVTRDDDAVEVVIDVPKKTS
jgi:hypothetical protein